MAKQLTSQVSEKPRPIFKNRPGLAAFIAIISGAAIASYYRVSWSLAILILVASALLLFAATYMRLRSLVNVVALISCAIVGSAIYSFAIHEHEISPLVRIAELGGRSKVTGIVATIEETRRGNLMIVQTSLLERDSTKLDASGELAVTMGQAFEDADVALPELGDTIILYAEIFPLRPERNPFTGSYDDRLKFHYGADATAELNSRFDYDLRRTHERTLRQDAERFFASIRYNCDRALSLSIQDSEASAFVRAVVLGTRGDIPQRVVQDFRYSGLTHLLAISGFNIAVVSLLIAQALLFLGIRRRAIRLPVTAIGVAFYCLVVGLEPSVLRAFVMIELFILSLVIERKSDLTNIAALTAIANIFIDPLVIHDAGFQLSYAAVFGFALIQPQLSRLFEPSEKTEVNHERTVIEWLRHSLVLSLAAFLATAPILIFHFRQVSLVVLIANLLAIPLAAMITTLGFILIPLHYFWPAAALIYGDAITWSVNVLILSSSWMASVTGSGLMVDLDLLTILFITFAGLWIIYAERRAQVLLRAAFAAVALLAASNFIDLGTRRILPENELSVVFADVGQGDAALVRTPLGKCYMFDFGPLNGSDLNFSARPYASLLQVEGIDRLEAGFLTHLHRDHYGAAFSAAYSDKLTTIYTVGDRTSDEFAFELDSLVRDREIKVKTLHSGQILELEQGLRIYVLGPDSTERSNAINNDRSLVLKIVYGNTSVLMLGDVEAEAEQQLVARYGSMLKSDVVKVAHHGSRSSSTAELVRVTHPKYSIVSCGRHNHFGHPHRSVLSRWLRSGAEVLRTDLAGAIILTSNGTTFRQLPWR